MIIITMGPRGVEIAPSTRCNFNSARHDSKSVPKYLHKWTSRLYIVIVHSLLSSYTQ